MLDSRYPSSVCQHLPYGFNISGLEDLHSLIRSRRSCLRIDAVTDVPQALLAKLCELATWAPNHYRTNPWQFAVLTGDGRDKLGETIAHAMANEGAPEASVAKTRTKYRRGAAIVMVGCAPGVDDLQTLENHHAVAAGVQNLLLGAHAAGLNALWGSVSTPTDESLLEFAGFVPDTYVVGRFTSAGPPIAAQLPLARLQPSGWISE